jgi:hypothetical protein
MLILMSLHRHPWMRRAEASMLSHISRKRDAPDSAQPLHATNQMPLLLSSFRWPRQEQAGARGIRGHECDFYGRIN